MSEIILKLEKSDINTSKMGNNYLIANDKFSVIMTPDAIEELIQDYNDIKSENDPDLKKLFEEAVKDQK